MRHIIKIVIVFIATLFMQQLMQQEIRACDVAVVSASASATGRPFIWKNRDHTESYRHQVLYFPEVKSGVGSSLRLMGETVINGTADPTTTCSGGANESGFALANTTVYDSNDPLDTSNINTNLVEKALEQCRTLAEFETLAKDYKSNWSGSTISGNFAVIDAHGGAAVYEMWTVGGSGNILQFRKFDVNTGALTDQDGAAADDNRFSDLETAGFNNRTNSFHTTGWREIASDTPRELRARQLLQGWKDSDQLYPRNIMRFLSKDVCGGTPADYFYDPADRAKATIIANNWSPDNKNDDNDTYLTPNRDGEMYTMYCISRYQTTMGLVIEGAATPDQANLTTMWVSLGEPSLSVFVPFFPYAHLVSAYATDNMHDNTGYYWDGVSATSSTKPTCFLNLMFDCMEANAFTSSGDYPELYNIFKNISLYTNNGAGNFTDYGTRNDGDYISYITGTRKMDTTIDYAKLTSLQTWTFPLEDSVFNGADSCLSIYRANPSLITREKLAEFSNYCCSFVYSNYTNRSSSYTAWSYELPDDGKYPSVASISPANGAADLQGRVPVTVVFSEPVDQSTINTGTFTVKNGSTVIPGSYDVTSCTVTFTPDSALSNNSAYTVQLTAGIKDLSGKNMAADFNSTFATIDDIAPAVVSVSPAYGSVSPEVNTKVTVSFSEPLDESTINTVNFKLMKGTSAVTGAVAYDPIFRTATFTPAASLDNSVTYTVILSTGIKDLTGNSLVYYGSTFTIAALVDVIAPTVSSVNPNDGAVNPPVSVPVTVKFSEAVDKDTVNESTFILMNGSDVIPGTVTYDSLLFTAKFTPGSALDNNSTYTVKITAGIKDLAGNSMASGFSSTFTISTATDPGEITATIKAVNTGNGGAVFPVDGSITVEFSESMNKDSITKDTFLVFNGSTAVTGTVSYNPETNTAIFIPDNALNYFTTYTVELTTGITNASGQALTDNYTWTFTTNKDGVAPAITYVSPADNEVQFSVSGKITAQFNKLMNKATIDKTTFKVTSDGISNVDGTIAYDEVNRIASFTPVSTLAAKTSYTVELTSEVMDNHGNFLENTKWTFTTTSEAVNNSSGSNGGGCGCGSAAEASTYGNGSRSVLPGLVSLLGTMLFPFALIWMHRKRRKNLSI